MNRVAQLPDSGAKGSQLGSYATWPECYAFQFNNYVIGSDILTSDQVV